MSRLTVRVGLSISVLGLVLVPSALADDNGVGGLAAPERPRIEQVSCASAKTACIRGQELQVAGDALHDARAVVFLGRSGRHDDRTAAPKSRDSHTLTVVVPRGAHSGPLRVISRSAGASRPSPRVRVMARVARAPASAPAATLAAGGGDFVFPIRGPHDLGQSASNGFGGGRGHQGQDMFAACGTPVVAARGGTVTKATYEARAGNYVVITDEIGRSYAYMHMRTAPLVAHGQQVATGQPLGEVGQTGRASGCHLHFELWTAPGWYMGGKPVDPLPELQRWDAAN